MARTEPSKEATLKEVLNEVSVADVGAMLRGWLATLGCTGVGVGIIFIVGAGAKEAGLPSDWGIPSWLVWSLIAWAFIYEYASPRSYHQLELRWYFPKQGWFGSLLLAVYAVGFVYLLIRVNHMPTGIEAGLAFFAVWFGYTSPFLAFLAITNFGHDKLMEKRRREIEAADNLATGTTGWRSE